MTYTPLNFENATSLHLSVLFSKIKRIAVANIIYDPRLFLKIKCMNACKELERIPVPQLAIKTSFGSFFLLENFERGREILLCSGKNILAIGYMNA